MPARAATPDSPADLAALAREIREACPPYPQERLSGRGIVIPAGGTQIFTNAYVLIHVLRRHLGCALPIEVWHFGRAELSGRMIALLRELGAETLDALPLIAETGARIENGWQLKSFALLHSRFAEVLLLDADQVPAVDPAAAFDWPQYNETGAVFWPDAADVSAENPVWTALGLPPKRAASFESGQILVDKSRHWRPLNGAFRLNEAAGKLYEFIYGDKDSFQLAWLLTEAAHSLVPHRPFVEERSLTQRDFEGAVFLQHRTNCKWSYAGAAHSFPAALHPEACEAALAELRRLWNGRIFQPPPRSRAARAAEARLIAGGPLVLEADGEERVRLQLWPDGEIGEGRSRDRQNWYVQDDASHTHRFCLILTWDGAPSHCLWADGNGGWKGRRRREPETAIAAYPMVPAPPSGSAPFTPCPLADDLLRAAGFPNCFSDGALANALILLARFEPNVEAHLRCRAERERGGHAQRLRRLADKVAAWEPGPVQPVTRPAGLFDTNYVRVPELSFGWQQ